jgi:hypothetical protein
MQLADVEPKSIPAAFDGRSRIRAIDLFRSLRWRRFPIFASPYAHADYLALLIRRHLAGVLPIFQCAECGQPTLDPVGWNGSGRPLCETCSEEEDDKQ